MARNERKSRHKALLRDVAELLGQKPDSLAVRLVALTRLKLDSVEAQLLSGDSSVTVDDITKLREVFDAYIPRPGLALRVTFVEPADAAEAGYAAIDGVAACRRCTFTPTGADRWPECPKCGWRCGHDVSSPAPLIAGPTSSPEPLPAATTSPPNVIPLNAEQRADLAAEKRAAARVTAGIDPGPPKSANISPCIGSPFSDNESPVALSRRIENAYR
jgi:hypothetical protein